MATLRETVCDKAKKEEEKYKRKRKKGKKMKKKKERWKPQEKNTKIKIPRTHDITAIMNDSLHVWNDPKRDMLSHIHFRRRRAHTTLPFNKSEKRHQHTMHQ